ncbi:hypothetical protein [Niabella ginsengisoli]|uniref:Signal transduction histidine kinase dimerisation/phosphoacceptor domain-containing protein n=1 Tax=Niabella ginsengisoli TaxID=522298 RepID=A0ABS9SKD4_9BACT|nr:hypothetical protein [Niabella ginsengisoli]MCH5598843.1 hypothetical protein [Niabella ginsengisoli]
MPDNDIDKNLATLFHDIKNCLNNIALATSILEIEPSELDNHSSYIKEIKDNYLKIKILISNYRNTV